MPSHIISYHIISRPLATPAQHRHSAAQIPTKKDRITFTSTSPPPHLYLKLTNLIQFNGSELSIKAAEETLAGSAVRAVRLGEDNDGVLVNEALGLSLCGGHSGG